MSAATRRRPALGVERLETRDVPAGNVLAFVSGGQLFITGGPNDNQVGVTQNAAGDVFVYGLNGTLVDGQPIVYMGRFIPANVIVDMRGGNDHFEIVGLVTGNVAVQGGDGNDSLIFINVHAFGNVQVTAGTGNDAVFLSGVTAGNLMQLAGGPGTDGLHFDTSVGFMGTFINNFEQSF